ncbi:MAG: hypothetical protein HOI69_09635 [Gammaproteobacteria bacterium]|nr:hypothetical protein [Gammaproteobacteria bacterium]
MLFALTAAFARVGRTAAATASEVLAVNNFRRVIVIVLPGALIEIR